MRKLLQNPFPGRRPRTGGVHLDSAMVGETPPAAVEPLLTALAADARPHELDGLAEALGHYHAAFPISRPTARTTWRRRMLSPIGASIAALALALGGTAAAAYTGSLPADAQDLAHHAIGAPAPRPASTTSPSTSTSSSQSPSATSEPSEGERATGMPKGPDATGPEAYGLCAAWTQHHANGATSSADDSVAFKNLEAAAGGAEKVEAYCAPILKAGHTTGKPTVLPTTAQTEHPGGRPDAMPTQAATGHPTGKPTKS